MAASGAAIAGNKPQTERFNSKTLASAQRNPHGYDGTATALYLNMLAHAMLDEPGLAGRDARDVQKVLTNRKSGTRASLRAQASAVQIELDLLRAANAPMETIRPLEQRQISVNRQLAGDVLMGSSFGQALIPGFSMEAVAASQRTLANRQWARAPGMDVQTLLDLIALSAPTMANTPTAVVNHDGALPDRLRSAARCLSASFEATKAMDLATGAAALEGAIGHLDARFWGDVFKGLESDLRQQQRDPNATLAFITSLAEVLDAPEFDDLRDMLESNSASPLITADLAVLYANDRLGAISHALTSLFSPETKQPIRSLISGQTLDELFDEMFPGADAKAVFLKYYDTAFEGLRSTANLAPLILEGPSPKTVEQASGVAAWLRDSRPAIAALVRDVVQQEGSPAGWQTQADLLQSLQTALAAAAEGFVQYERYAVGDAGGERESSKRVGALLDELVSKHAPQARTGEYRKALVALGSNASFDERSDAAGIVFSALLDAALNATKTFAGDSYITDTMTVVDLVDQYGPWVKKALPPLVFGGRIQKLNEQENWRSIVDLGAPLHDGLVRAVRTNDGSLREAARDASRSLLTNSETGVQAGISGSAFEMTGDPLGAYLLALYRTGDSRRFGELTDLVNGLLDGVDDTIKSGNEGGLALLPDSFLRILNTVYLDASDTAMVSRISAAWSHKAGDRPLLGGAGLDATQAGRAWRDKATAREWDAYAILNAAIAGGRKPSLEEAERLLRNIDQMRPSTLSDELKEAAIFRSSDNPDLAEAYQDWKVAHLKRERATEVERQIAYDTLMNATDPYGPLKVSEHLGDIIQTEANARAELDDAIDDSGLSLSLAPITVRSLQTALKQKEVLVGASLVGDLVVTVAIEKTGGPIVSWSKVDRARLGRQIAAYSLGLTSGELRTFDTQTAYQLFAQIFGADEQSSVRQALARATRVVWAPGNGLDTFPIGALVTREQPGAALTNVQWFASDHELMTTPSFEAFQIIRQTSQTFPNDKILMVGDIPFTGSPPAGRRTNLSDAAGPNAPASIAAYLKQFTSIRYGRELFDAPLASKAVILRGPEATEREVRDAADAAYQTVVFYTHAADLQETAWSRTAGAIGLVLYPEQLDQPDHDGIFGLDEIATAGLRARLVVLAACATGAAGASGGEPLSGIARAFLIGGAGGVLASHNKVDDETAALMARLVTEQVNAGQGPSAALALAQMRLLQDGKFAHPYYWAQYEIVGEGAR